MSHAQNIKSYYFSITDLFIKDMEGLKLIRDNCKYCNFIYKHRPEIKCVCPNCNKTDPTLWPHPNLYILIDRLYYFRKAKIGKELSVIIFCSIFEGLFDDFFLKYILEKEKTSAKIAELVLRRYSSLEQRVTELYKKIVGVSFKHELNELGYSKFYANWISIKNARDNFIHLNDTLIDNTIIKITFKILPDLFSIFAGLNNKYLLNVKNRVVSA